MATMLTVAEVVEAATLTQWFYIGGRVRDAIRIPHPAEGDEPYSLIYGQELEWALMDALAPGRVVVDGGSDETGECYILEEPDRTREGQETKKREYWILSGEGTEGTWERTRPMTDIGIKRRLTRERCGGDRWARAYHKCTSDVSNVWINTETGEARHIGY